MATKRNNLIYFPNQEKLKKYEEKGVYFSKPHLVAFYDYKHGKTSNAQRIYYYKNPTDKDYPLDLNVDFSSFICREPEMHLQFINHTLKYCMSSFDQIVEISEKTKVFTRRGTLASIMKYYYNQYNEHLVVLVSRYKGNLYIVKENNDTSNNELKPKNVHHSRLKQLLFSDKPFSKPKTDESCNENICLTCVHRSNFGKYDVIYSGEIHGILADEEFNDFDDLEALNDCRFVFVKQMWERIRHKDEKYLLYWLQAYLANVKEIYIGYKTKDGIVNEPIELNYVRDLPKNRNWKPEICTGFLYEFLQNVEKNMSSVNCLNTVYKYKFNWKYKNISYEIFKGPNDSTFITKEYMEFCRKI